MSRELRKRMYCGDKSRTDQSYKKSSDVNLLLAKYLKSGILHQPNEGKGFYADVSDVPDLAQAFSASQMALQAFQSLPADIRKDMDNDPLQLEIWLSNEANHKKAIEHGLINKKDEIVLDDNQATSDESSSIDSGAASE